MFVRGSRSRVSGIGGTSGPLVTQPGGGATDSMVAAAESTPRLLDRRGRLWVEGGSGLGGVPAQP